MNATPASFPEVASIAGSLPLRGGDLSLDFTNTVSSRGTEDEADYLKTYTDLLAWSVHAGGLAEADAARLAAAAAGRAAPAGKVLARGQRLREALYRIFAAHAAGRTPRERDLGLLNAELARALAHRRVEHTSGAFRWGWEDGAQALDRVLWPIAQSAAELLISGELARVHQCENESCGWLFVDRSRNHSRRWCDMDDCGNVAKVRRYRSRHKQAE